MMKIPIKNPLYTIFVLTLILSVFNVNVVAISTRSASYKKIMIDDDSLLDACEPSTAVDISATKISSQMACVIHAEKLGKTVFSFEGTTCLLYGYYIAPQLHLSSYAGTKEVYVRTEQPAATPSWPANTLKDVALGKPVEGTTYPNYRLAQTVTSGVACQATANGCYCSSTSTVSGYTGNDLKVDLLASYRIKAVIITLSMVDYLYFRDNDIHIGMAGDDTDPIIATVPTDLVVTPFSSGQRVVFQADHVGRFILIKERLDFASCICLIEAYA